MPSRDPSQDDPTPEPRWGSEMPREPGRDGERRHRPTAFSEWEQGLRDGPADTSGGPPPAPALDRRRAVSGWERKAAERERVSPDSARSRARPDDSPVRRPSAGGAVPADDTQFDADYRQWRDEQMRLLDLDYAQWRKERYRKFAEEFSQWRSQRLKASPVGRSQDVDTPASLGDISPLGTPPGPVLRGEARERPQAQERERSGGGLLGSLLGGHSERHKPQP